MRHAMRSAIDPSCGLLDSPSEPLYRPRPLAYWDRLSLVRRSSNQGDLPGFPGLGLRHGRSLALLQNYKGSETERSFPKSFRIEKESVSGKLRFAAHLPEQRSKEN